MVLLSALRNTAVKRLPLIKFRKGGNQSAAMASPQSHGITEVKTNVQLTQTRAASGQSIEDWQLPPRYRRSVIDDKECNYINSGGATV